MSAPDHKGCCNTQQIVSDFYDQIYAYVFSKVQNPEHAKDITQEVMGRLMMAYEKNTQILNIRAWLFQVCKNLIVDYYRKKDNLSYQEDAVERIPEEDEGPEITTEDFIVPMIKLLPESYGTPLYLSDIKKIKQADIAKELNISLSAAKMRVQRGRKMLYDLFTECCDIEYAKDGSFVSCTIKSSCEPLLKVEKDLNRLKKS